jgi:arginine repressor
MNIFAQKMNIYTQAKESAITKKVAIRNVINQNTVTSQEQLLMLLKRKGFEMTTSDIVERYKRVKDC